MTTQRKRRLFQVSLWSSGVLYIWGLLVLWMAPEWGLSDDTFYVVGVLPSAVGVFTLSAALGLYMDLNEKDEC